MKTQFITINPMVFSEEGHAVIYNECLELAANENNWSFKALFPKSCLTKNFPPHWKKTLCAPLTKFTYPLIKNKPYKQPKKIYRAYDRVKYYFSCYQSLKKELKNNKKKQRNILFLDCFQASDLKLLTSLFKLLPKKNLSIWVFHRHPSRVLLEHLSLYQKCYRKLVEYSVDLQLFCDSGLLKEDIQRVFEMPVNILPIPHVEDIKSSKSDVQAQAISCWWPGAPRPGKGKKIIQDFVSSNFSENKKIDLHIIKSTEVVENPSSPNVHYIKSYLSRGEYISRLHEANVILLPYVDKHYRKATSGIFVEALLAHKIPLVYQNTWMAEELKKFDLNELIIDWDQSQNLAKKIITLYQNKEIRRKTTLLHDHYKSYHSQQNFKKILKDSLL